VNGVTGGEAERKLWYDMEYIRRQSLVYDVGIVVRQVWKVVEDIIGA